MLIHIEDDILRRFHRSHQLFLRAKTDQSGSCECVFRFTLQEEGQTITRVRILLREMLKTPPKALSDMSLGAGMFQNMVKPVGELSYLGRGGSESPLRASQSPTKIQLKPVDEPS